MDINEKQKTFSVVRYLKIGVFLTIASVMLFFLTLCLSSDLRSYLSNAIYGNILVKKFMIGFNTGRNAVKCRNELIDLRAGVELYEENYPGELTIINDEKMFVLHKRGFFKKSNYRCKALSEEFIDNTDLNQTYYIPEPGKVACTIHQVFSSTKKGNSPFRLFNKGNQLLSVAKTADQKKEAFLLFQSASLAGNNDAKHSLGFCYEEGFGVAKDLEKAFFWYESGAKNNHVKCLLSVKRFSLNGTFEEKDIETGEH